MRYEVKMGNPLSSIQLHMQTVKEAKKLRMYKQSEMCQRYKTVHGGSYFDSLNLDNYVDGHDYHVRSNEQHSPTLGEIVVVHRDEDQCRSEENQEAKGADKQRR